MNKVNEYITYLQKYEKAGEKKIEIFDGQENSKFLSIWFNDNQIKNLLKDNKNKDKDKNKISISEVYQDKNNLYIEVNFYIFFKFF
jgi:hypothetical protein